MTTTSAEMTRPMNCNEFVEIITDYLEHQLSGARRAWTDEHLAACGKCRAYLDQMEQTIVTLRRLGDERLDPVEHERIMALLRARRPLSS